MEIPDERRMMVSKNMLYKIHATWTVGWQEGHQTATQ